MAFADPEVKKRIKAKSINVVGFERMLGEEMIFVSRVLPGLEGFLQVADIIASRPEEGLSDVTHKVYSRDILVVILEMRR